MSRSRKCCPDWSRRWTDKGRDSHDEKAGVHRRARHVRPEIALAVGKRRMRGSTEKILRRNRRIFERLAGKLGRRADKEEIARQDAGR